MNAANVGNLEAVNKIIDEAGGLDSATLSNALNAGAFNGHLNVVKTLLERGADPNARAQNGRSALDCAVENLQVDIVKLLLGCADVNAQDQFGTSPLHAAIDTEAEHAKRLYDDGDVDAHPIIVVSDLLIAAGANVNARTKKGETPLRWAIDQGHSAAEQLLRQHGGGI